MEGEVVAGTLYDFHITREQRKGMCPWHLVLERLFWKVLSFLCIVMYFELQRQMLVNILKIVWLIKQTIEILINNLKLSYWEAGKWKAWAFVRLRGIFVCFIVLTSPYVQVLNAPLIQIEEFKAFSDFVYGFTWASCYEQTSSLVHLDLSAVMNPSLRRLEAIRFFTEQNLVHAEFTAEADLSSSVYVCTRYIFE